MDILSNQSVIKKIDKQNMLGSIEALDKQIKQTWTEHRDFKLPVGFKKINKVVVAGMGGSALPTRLIKALFKNELTVPVEISNDYNLPGYVDNQTLVLLSSYSGSTEEVIFQGQQAQKKKAKVVVVGSGAQLAKMHKSGVPGIIFAPKYNPSNQPRMGLGYAVMSQIIIFRELGILSFSVKEFDLVMRTVAAANQRWGIGSVPASAIKKLARALKSRSLLFVGAEHLLGSVHAAANQMNENGKRLAVSFPVPELNHHLLEGLRFPDSNEKNILAVMFESKLYYKRVQKRFQITRSVMKNNHIPCAVVQLLAKTRLAQVFEALVASSYLSYYAALLEGVDPSPIPYVDYFKEQLAK